MKPVSVPHLPSCLQEPSRAWSRPTLCSECCTPDPKPNPAKAAATASPRPLHLPQHRPCRAPRGTQLHQEWPWLPSGHVGAPGEWELEVSGTVGGPEGWEGRCPCTGRAAHPAALGGEQSSCCPSAGMRRACPAAPGEWASPPGDLSRSSHGREGRFCGKMLQGLAGRKFPQWSRHRARASPWQVQGLHK